MKIIPKLNEINYTIVPPSRDGGKSVGTQIRGLRDVFKRDDDTITVDDDAVFEEKEIVTEDAASGTDQWLKVFDTLLQPNGGDVGPIHNIPKQLAHKLRIPITAEVINILQDRFINQPELYQNITWLDRSHKVLKNAGVGKIITDQDDNITYYRKGAIQKDEVTLQALRNFINVIKANRNNIEGDVQHLDKIIRSYDNLFSGEGNADQKKRGGGSTAKRTGILDITKDLSFRANEINNFIFGEIKKLEQGQPENPGATDRIERLISTFRVTTQSVKLNATPDQKKAIAIKQKIDNTNDPIEKKNLESELKFLAAQGVNLPDNVEGDDLVDANLLLTYATLIGNLGLVKSVFELHGREVNFKQQERIGGKFSKSLIKRLKDFAILNDYTDIVTVLTHHAGIKESFMPKKIIMSERQAKLLSMLKEETLNECDCLMGMTLASPDFLNRDTNKYPTYESYMEKSDENISENTATDITKKEMGYRHPSNHRKIKNIDKTDYCKKLKDERESKTNVAQNVTRNVKTFGYKTPTNRKRSMSVHKGDNVEEKERRNDFFAKEVRVKRYENKVFTKKELIESILKNSSTNENI